MKVHTLKIWPHFLDEIETGRKTFDVRSAIDRCFQAGDQVALQAYDPARHELISRAPVVRNITAVYVDLPGVQQGYVVLQLAPVVKL